MNINDYLWSSYDAYLGEKNRFTSMVDTEFILEMFGNKDERKKSFKKFMETENEDNCLDNNQPKLSDEELKKELAPSS
ncbi:MAG: hypothetical protein KGZ63_00150 [Clostridiales bacterium]|nr:hypothetical protein [Clostridiales bacterium]